MPKQKSSSSAKRRFKILKSGKIKRAQSGKAHKANFHASPKRRKNVRNKNKGAYVFEGEARTVKILVGKGGR